MGGIISHHLTQIKEIEAVLYKGSIYYYDMAVLNGYAAGVTLPKKLTGVTATIFNAHFYLEKINNGVQQLERQ